MWIVETGVKGAYRLNSREFATEAEAEAFAARWRSSNSTGDYIAHVTNDEDEPCDCGGPRNDAGFYITHAQGSHPDCCG